MTKKYKLSTTDTIDYLGRKLYRIIALKDFSNVKAGDLGGYVEHEGNLSHENNCWIYNNAKIYDEAHVYEGAYVRDDANRK